MAFAHVVAEVVGGTVIALGTHIHLVASGVASAQIAVIYMALERACSYVGDVGTALDEPVSGVEGCHYGHGEHPQVALGDEAPCVHSLKLVAALNHLHVIVLHRGVDFHSLVLKSHSSCESPFAPKVFLGVESEGDVGLEVVAVELADGGGHAHGSRAADVVADAECVVETVGEAYSPRRYGEGKQCCQSDKLFHSHIIFTLSIHRVLPGAPS